MTVDARKGALLGIFKGVLIALLAQGVGMAILAFAVVTLGLSDTAITVCNQALKVVAICAGVRAAVGIGGTRGFLLGSVTGLLYMVLCYAIYCLLDGALVSPGLLVAEFLIGAALGALSGAVVANLRPRARKHPSP